MRKVIVSKMQRVRTATNPDKYSYEKVQVGEAWFHQFGINYEEFENGPGSFTCAVIEWPTGKVELVAVNMIEFVNEPF